MQRGSGSAGRALHCASRARRMRCDVGGGLRAREREAHRVASEARVVPECVAQRARAAAWRGAALRALQTRRAVWRCAPNRAVDCAAVHASGSERRTEWLVRCARCSGVSRSSRV